jgi:hypothetical protein
VKTQKYPFNTRQTVNISNHSFCQITLDKSGFLYYDSDINLGFFVMQAYIFPSKVKSEVAVSENNIHKAVLSHSQPWACLLQMKSGKILAVNKEKELVKNLAPTEFGYVNSQGKIVIV